MEFWVVLGGFRQPKNGLGRLPATEKRTTMKKNANTDAFKGFGMLEYWAHCKNQCFGPTLYWRVRKLCCFWRKDWNNTVRTCVLDRLYAQKCINYVGVEGKQSKNTANIFLKHVQYLYKELNQKTCGVGGPPREAGWIYSNFQIETVFAKIAMANNKLSMPLPRWSVVLSPRNRNKRMPGINFKLVPLPRWRKVFWLQICLWVLIRMSHMSHVTEALLSTLRFMPHIAIFILLVLFLLWVAGPVPWSANLTDLSWSQIPCSWADIKELWQTDLAK